MTPLFLLALIAPGCALDQVNAGSESFNAGGVHQTTPESLPIAETTTSTAAALTTSTPDPLYVGLPQPSQPRMGVLAGRITHDGVFEAGEITQFVWSYPGHEAYSPETLAEIVVYDQDGLELHRRPFNVGRQLGDVIENVPWVPAIRSIGDAQNPAMDYVGVRVSYPAFFHAAAVAIELEGAEIWREHASYAAPVVSISVEGSVIEWDATDADGVPPRSTIYYLIDGWDRIEVLGGSSLSSRSASAVDGAQGENRIDLSKGGLVGSESATVLIFSSDGFNYSFAVVSDVTVSQGDPIVFLMWPEGARVQNSFNFLGLEASVGEPSGSVCMGYSCQLPEGYEVVWTSDLDGEIARGANVEIFPEDRTGLLPLQIGTHLITVTVTDSFGNSVSESGELTIR